MGLSHKEMARLLCREYGIDAVTAGQTISAFADTSQEWRTATRDETSFLAYLHELEELGREVEEAR